MSTWTCLSTNWSVALEPATNCVWVQMENSFGSEPAIPYKGAQINMRWLLNSSTTKTLWVSEKWKLFCLLQSDSYCLGSMFSGLWWRFSWILNFTPLYAVLFAKVIQIWFKHISSEVSMDFELENSWHFHPRWHSNVRNRTIDFVGNLNASLWRSPIGDAMVVARVPVPRGMCMAPAGNCWTQACVFQKLVPCPVFRPQTQLFTSATILVGLKIGSTQSAFDIRSE